MSNQSLWLNVLLYFDRKGYFSNGLTIPFLLGANSIISPGNDNLDVSGFVDEIIEESLPYKISIQRCGNIGEYVIGIFDKESPSRLYRNFGNLYITDSSFLLLNSIEEIKAILIENYQARIDAGQYSINGREWSNYSNIETEHLEELKQ